MSFQMLINPKLVKLSRRNWWKRMETQIGIEISRVIVFPTFYDKRKIGLVVRNSMTACKPMLCNLFSMLSLLTKNKLNFRQFLRLRYSPISLTFYWRNEIYWKQTTILSEYLKDIYCWHRKLYARKRTKALCKTFFCSLFSRLETFEKICWIRNFDEKSRKLRYCNNVNQTICKQFVAKNFLKAKLEIDFENNPKRRKSVANSVWGGNARKPLWLTAFSSLMNNPGQSFYSLPKSLPVSSIIYVDVIIKHSWNSRKFSSTPKFMCRSIFFMISLVYNFWEAYNGCKKKKQSLRNFCSCAINNIFSFYVNIIFLSWVSTHFWMILQRVQSLSLVGWAVLGVLWGRQGQLSGPAWVISEVNVDWNQCGFWCILQDDRHYTSQSTPWQMLCNFLDSGRVIYNSPSTRRLWMFTSLRDKRQCIWWTTYTYAGWPGECWMWRIWQNDRAAGKRVKKSCWIDCECLKGGRERK